MRRLAVLAVLLAALAHADEHGGPPHFKHLAFRNVGPALGGRACRAAGVPGDPLTYYAATAASGLWKSTDGGIRWHPLTDKLSTSTFGSLALAPSDANVLYAGSGEANIRGNVEVGTGIYRSTDAGKTWQHVWKQEGQIGEMVVHPKDPDTAFAAVLGKAFGPNPERGIYRTTDGGKTWKQVLKKDADTGASAVCMSPGNPRVLFAGLWQTRRRPWEMTSGGPGSGLYITSDGGDSWTQLVPPPEDDKAPAKGTKHARGLPKGIWGRIGLAIAPSEPKRIFALIEAEEGGLFRSDDGGDTWDRVNSHRVLRQRPWYFSTLTVHPRNPDVVYFPQVPLLRSIDGGKTLHQIKVAYHGDNHDLWIDPKSPERMIVANDGGVNISTNGGKDWYAPPLPWCQFYRVSVDNHTPYRIAGTIQDIGTAQGPSNSLRSGGIWQAAWRPVGGGEAGHTSSDPKDPNVVWATEYMGYITRFDRRTGQARPVPIYPFNASGHGAEALKYRFQWTAPVLASAHEEGVVYHAANVLFRTADGGKTWKPISPDLTRNDRTKMKWSGGPITGDNTGVEVYGTIFALAESPVRKGLLWAGSDDGLVHVSSDGGEKWDNVTPKEGLPRWATVLCIEPSPHDARTAYVVAENHRLDDRKPYLFVTRDLGRTWAPLTAGLPDTGWLCVVREDPKAKGLLYLGAERGLFTSADGGEKWEQLRLNLPPVRVSDVRVKDDDLVVATNGRSVWVFDDLTPIRRWKEASGKAVALLPPRPAVRWRYADSVDPKAPMSVMPNPPEGAILHYHLKSAPKGEVVIEILDAKGGKIRTLTSKKPPAVDTELEASWSQYKEPDPLPKTAGLHRVVWDLRHEGAVVIPGAKFDAGQPRSAFLAVPGTYTVRLSVDGTTAEAKLEVRPDPRQGMEGLAEQQAFALKVRDSISAVSRSVIALRSVRSQIEAREKLLKDDDRDDVKKLLSESKALVKRLDALEARYHNPKAQVSYDILAMKGGAQLYSQLAWLHEMLKSADGPPPQGVRDVYTEQAGLLAKYEKEWAGLKEEVRKLNALAKEADVPGVVVPK